MATVKVKKGDLEGALDQLRKICKGEKIVSKYRENEYYVKPGDKRRKRKAEAKKVAKRANRKNGSKRVYGRSSKRTSSSK